MIIDSENKIVYMKNPPLFDRDKVVYANDISFRCNDLETVLDFRVVQPEDIIPTDPVMGQANRNNIPLVARIIVPTKIMKRFLKQLYNTKESEIIDNG